MSEAEFVSGPSGAAEWLIDAALLITVGLFVGSVFSLYTLAFVISLAMSLHVFVSLYHGRFGRFRKITWSMIFVGWLALAVVGLLTDVAKPFGDPAAEKLLFAASTLVVMLGLVLDFFGLHGPRLRTSRVTQVASVIGFLAVLVVVAQDVMRLSSAIEQNEPSKLDQHVLISANVFSPLVALVRASESVGLWPTAIISTLAALGGLWAWRRAWRFHAPLARRPFTGLWLAAGTGWIVLGLVGGAQPQAWWTGAAVVTAIYEIAFLAATPFVLARFVKPRPDRRAEIFG